MINLPIEYSLILPNYAYEECFCECKEIRFPFPSCVMLTLHEILCGIEIGVHGCLIILKNKMSTLHSPDVGSV